MEYILPKNYLSASSIKMLLRCPKQYEFRYIQDIVIPPNAALITGSAMHKALETYYKEAMTSAQRFTPEQTAELAVQSLEDIVEEQDSSVISDAEITESVNSLKSIAKVYVDNIASHIEPLAVEEEVRYKSACGVDILAYLDLRRKMNPEENGLGQAEGICDYKITSRKWAINQLRDSLQFNLYSLVTGLGDIEVHNMVKNTVPKRLNKKPEVYGVRDVASNMRILHHCFKGDGNRHMEELIESCARLITSGIFPPCDPESWCCNPTWCGYWQWCRGRSDTCTPVTYVDMK